MRLLVLLFLTATMLGAADTDCRVDCPEKTHGACIKFEGKCYCRCLVNADALSKELLNRLQELGASQELLDSVKVYLSKNINESSAEKTFKDPKTGKNYTVFLKKGPSIKTIPYQ